MTIDHKNLYDTDRMSTHYAARDYLEPAENTFIEDMGRSLASMNMLDIGVGGGRTTKYFAPLVNSYIGADYAPCMIKACKNKYGDKYSFIECDARNMEVFDGDSFDFIFFSFNGIDSFSHDDRLKALKEIRRILRDGGLFYFSSHNLYWKGLEEIFKLKTPGSMIDINAYARHAFKIIRLNLLNKSFKINNHIKKVRKHRKGHIYDNSLEGRAGVYYISKNEQLQQLRDCGFKEVYTYSQSGIRTKDDMILDSGGWIYYLCK